MLARQTLLQIKDFFSSFNIYFSRIKNVICLISLQSLKNNTQFDDCKIVNQKTAGTKRCSGLYLIINPIKVFAISHYS
jgi:hypothetical protein